MSEPDLSPDQAPQRRARRLTESLAARLFALTLGAILLTEALVFIPTAGNVRTQWLTERAQAARIAALALEAAPMREVSEELSSSLLEKAEVLAVTEVEDDMRFQLLAPAMEIEEAPTRIVDLRAASMMGRSAAALGEYFAPEGEMLVILAEGSESGRVIEVVVPQAPLKKTMVDLAWRVTGFSLIIALVAAVVIYLVLNALVVGPVRRVTVSVEQFSRDPGS